MSSRHMDVVQATAEALPLELLNRINKELTAQLSHFENQLQEKLQGTDDQRRRLQFMKEHLSNVRGEIVNTQSLVESKRREVESEDGMCRLITRECGRLGQRWQQLRHDEAVIQDQITAAQNRIFQQNLRMEELKGALSFNQEELEQWDEARRQKEEDELAVAQYSKQDEARIRKLTQRVEQVESAVRSKRRQLEDEVLAAHNTQTELDHCAADYRKLHDDRSGMLAEWERVVRSITERDQAIRVAAEQYAEGAEWLLRRIAVKKDLGRQLDEVMQETIDLNYAIQEHEKKAQQLRDAVPVLTRQVEDLADEAGAMREQVSRSVKERNNRRARLQEMSEEIERKATEVKVFEQRREAAAARLQEEIAAAKDMHQQSALILQLFADSKKMNASIDKDIEALKKRLFKANQELHEVRTRQNDLLAELTGAQLQGKNINASIAKLDSESFAQQSVLYTIEFNVQLMEKKVRRAKGERTIDERRDLQEKIELLQATLDKLEQQHRVLDTQAKHVREDLRQSNLASAKLDTEKTALSSNITGYELECSHCEHELKKLEKDLEDALINTDTLTLQLQRLRRCLALKEEELSDVQERKRQLEADVAEREAEVAVHHSLLKMEGKVAEEERRRLAAELLEQQKALAAVRNRHAVVVGRLDPAQARLTQAQLVIQAAKEREDLQFRGDSLDARVKRMEKEMLKLEKTIATIKASNIAYKHKFDAVTEQDEEVKAQQTLLERFRDLKLLMSKRAMDTNNYHATVVAKQDEAQRLRLEHDKLEHTLQALKQHCNGAVQGVVQAREDLIRYDQAIAKSSNAVGPAISRDVELTETSERLTHAVDQLLQCARRAGEEVHAAVKQIVLEANIAIDPAMAAAP